MKHFKQRPRLLFINTDGGLLTKRTPGGDLPASFFPGVFHGLAHLRAVGAYEFVMIVPQRPSASGSENYVIKTFANENIFLHQQSVTDAFTLFANDDRYDIANSYVVGDEAFVTTFSADTGCKAILLAQKNGTEIQEIAGGANSQAVVPVLTASDWWQVADFLSAPPRTVMHTRKSKETNIVIQLNLDGSGIAKISTGLNFFDHMLEQLARHSGIDIHLNCEGDLHVDEHHSIEDVGITLGEAFALALQDKRGLERYGFVLPMDDALASVALDFGGRPWLVWKVKFKRERIGDMPTEMFEHFFKSFSDAARCNINIRCKGKNEHHKIEAVFKAFAKSIKMAVKRDIYNRELPSTKGIL